jgi:hypothetical protein
MGLLYFILEIRPIQLLQKSALTSVCLFDLVWMFFISVPGSCLPGILFYPCIWMSRFDVLSGFGGGRIASISDTPRVFDFYTAYDWDQISRHTALRKCVTLSLLFYSIILFGICFIFSESLPLSQCTRRKQKIAEGSYRILLDPR